MADIDVKFGADLGNLPGGSKTAQASIQGVNQAVASIGTTAAAITGSVTSATAAVNGLTGALSNAAVAAHAMPAVVQPIVPALNNITQSAGQTRANLMNLRAQMIDIGQGVPLLFTSPLYGLINFGNQLAQVSQITGSFGSALRLVASEIVRIVIAFSPLLAIVGAVAGAIRLMQVEINASQKVQVSYGAVIVGVFRTIRDGIANVLAPAGSALGPFFSKVWDGLLSGIRTTINYMIGAFVAAFNNIKFVWANLPDILGAVAIGAANAVVKAIEAMVNGAIFVLNKLIGLVNKIPKVNLKELSEVSAGEFENPYAKRLASAPNQGSFQKDLNADYLGQFFSAIKGNAIAYALEPTKAQLKAAAAEAKRLEKALKDIISNGAERAANIRAETTALGLNTEQATAYREEMQMINDATQKGITLKAQDRAAIHAQAQAIGAATAQLERSRAIQASLQQLAQGITDAFMGWLKGTETLGQAFLQLALQIAAAVVEAIILAAVMTALGLPTSAAGPLVQIAGSMFGGGKAEGGSLEPGKWYIAGERGPEAIWGGGTGAFAGGYGATNGQAGGMGGPMMGGGPSAKDIARELGKVLGGQGGDGVRVQRSMLREMQDMRRRISFR